MKEALAITLGAVIIYYVITKVQHQSFIFKLQKEEKKPEQNNETDNTTEEDANKVGQDLYNKGDMIGSEKKFLEAVKSNPKNSEPYHFLGMIYLRQKMYKGAIAALEQATKLNPLDDTAFNNLGLAYMNIDNYEEAIENFEKSVSLNDKIAHRYLNLALAYQKVQKFEKAAIALEAAVKIHPNTENQTLLAKNYLEMGAHKLAHKAIEKLLETDPENTWAKRQLATLKD